MKSPGVCSAPAATASSTDLWHNRNTARTWRTVFSLLVGFAVAWCLVFRAFPGLDRLLSWQPGERTLGIGIESGSGPASSRRRQWSDIEASRTLTWEPCYNGQYDCARLDVPMDWLDPSDDERVFLAVMRLNATDTSDYKGSVFFNPGGPGGSGVFALKDHGDLIQTIVGRNHDIISFDPRGISASVPRIDCWGSPDRKHLWQLKDVGMIDAHPGVLNDAYVRAAAFSRTCEMRMMGESNLLRHISTASHARDMLEILQQTGNEKLRYWGFSYGTILGGVFAAMYPDKVERLLSDGNVDYREWHNDEHINFIRDSDKVMQAFFDFCYKAGPLSCAFYAENPVAIENRLHDLLASIRKSPLPVVPDRDGSGPDMPEIVTWSHVKQLIGRTLYQPNLMFKKFAEILLALEKKDPRPFYEFVRSEHETPPICSIEAIPPTVPRMDAGNDEAFPVISCADHPPLTETVEEFAAWAEKAMEISSATGDVNALSRLSCIGRTVRPKWRFDGPFEGKTSHPILYVANMADNVTPLISARNNSQGFEGSRILIQNAYGHTTLAAPSTCTANYIRDYFQNGTLPEEGTTCDPDYYPFDNVKHESTDDDELAQASRRLSEGRPWGFIPRVKI